MSKSIVVNIALKLDSFIRETAKKTKSTIVMIKKAGLPPIMADYCVSGNDFKPVSMAGSYDQRNMAMLLEGPVPMSLTQRLAKCGSGAFPLPETRAKKDGQMESMYLKPETSASLLKTKQKEAPEVIDTAPVLIPANEDKIPKEEDPKVIDGLVTDFVLAAFDQNNIQVKSREEIVAGVTRITVDDIIRQNRAHMPEYVPVRRG